MVHGEWILLVNGELTMVIVHELIVEFHAYSDGQLVCSTVTLLWTHMQMSVNEPVCD